VRSNIDLAHGLGLADLGCDLVQGHLTGRPSALADLALHPPREAAVA